VLQRPVERAAAFFTISRSILVSASSLRSLVCMLFITGRADVPSTVLAMKGGANDVLTKPLDEDALMRAVDAAIARAHVLRKEAEDAAALQALHQSLTPREQELLPLLASGRPNKQAAADLGISEYTVQVHRGHIMRKMQADSFATLVRQASKLQLETSSTRRRTASPAERLFRERS
jgi:FixJ family two-component response regulator